jgi:DNA-binding protein HU-beta
LGVKTLHHAVKITTGLPSVAKAAKKLGVSRKVVKELSQLAERSQKTGKFVLPGVGRLVMVKRRARIGRNPATGQMIKIPGKGAVNYRIVKSSRTDVHPKKK